MLPPSTGTLNFCYSCICRNLGGGLWRLRGTAAEAAERSTTAAELTVPPTLGHRRSQAALIELSPMFAFCAPTDLLTGLGDMEISQG